MHYDKIRAQDFADRQIAKHNWSGSDVKFKSKTNPKKTNHILLQLMSDDVLLWLTGVRGFIIMFRKYLRIIVQSTLFEQIVVVSVVLNTLVLSLDGVFNDGTINQAFDNLNLTFTLIFTVEMVFKIVGFGLLEYVRDVMNIFDGLIVIMSLVELIFLQGGTKAVSAFRSVRIFRVFRVLRVTKLLRALEFMRVIINVVQKSLSSFVYIAMLLFLFLFIYTLLGRQFYAG